MERPTESLSRVYARVGGDGWMDNQIDKKTARQADWKDAQTNGRTDGGRRQTDRQRQSDRQADRLMAGVTDRQTDK